jgi:predicted RNase H-like nuclease
MDFVGADGCKAGWLAVNLSLFKDWEVNLFSSFSQLWDRHSSAALILVDIPIGLRQGSSAKGCVEREERRCDKKARKLLGPRRAAVFRVPCRPAIYASSYDEAIAKNEKLTGTRIFKATWNITGKIREVDELLLNEPEIRKSVREIHPEVCFWSLNGCQPLQYPKRQAAGASERLNLLQSIYPSAEDLLSRTLASYSRQEVKKDDILDALVAAITAKIGFDNLSAIPPQPEIDLRGLPMEMVYFLLHFHKSKSPNTLKGN